MVARPRLARRPAAMTDATVHPVPSLRG